MVDDQARADLAHEAHEAEERGIEAVLERVLTDTGIDFRDYARASLRRRFLRQMEIEGCRDLVDLERRLHDGEVMERFVRSITVHSTAMFRDPPFFRAVREHVVPILRSYPFIRIWHAGCATGEEAYSLAILLEEEGLSERCRVYATDMSEAVLEKARNGIFSLSVMREYTRNYLESGGRREFSEYYTARHESAMFRPELARRILFARHNLVTDRSFNEFHFVLCRNVMIYFNRDLQERVHELLYSSLGTYGILALGEKESLRLTSREGCFRPLDPNVKLYVRSR